MLLNPQGDKIGGTGDDLQFLINKAMLDGYTRLELQGAWNITKPLSILSRKSMDRFELIGRGATLINNVENNTMLNFESTHSTIWDKIELRGFKIATTGFPINSDCVHVSGGCFGGGIYDCYVGGNSGSKILKGSAIVLTSNHEDFGLTKNFEISNCKLFFLDGHGIITRSANSTPAYITVRKSDIEMCHQGGIVGSYEGLIIEQNIIAYNGKATNLGGINLYGLISYNRNIVIRDNGFEHNAGCHVNLDRITNCEIKMNSMVGLSNGVNGFNNDIAIKSIGEYGTLYMDIDNNRIESVKTGYLGIKANDKVKIIKDNLNQFVFSGGTPREFSPLTKVVGIREDGTILN